MADPSRIVRLVRVFSVRGQVHQGRVVAVPDDLETAARRDTQHVRSLGVWDDYPRSGCIATASFVIAAAVVIARLLR